jgi:hypothetical protein
MPSLAIVKKSNANIADANSPRVIVLVGATAGIAKATLILLVAKKPPLKIYIIGRNELGHKPFLEELRSSNLNSTITWLEGQVSLLSETQRSCNKSLSFRHFYFFL